jgi:hypothetical protein
LAYTRYHKIENTAKIVLLQNTAKYTHPPLTMKKLSEIQKTRNTKILLSNQDWEEEMGMQKMDLDLLRSGTLNLKQISLISQRAFQRLKIVNEGCRYTQERMTTVSSGI